jgi:hypothetical protein
MSVVSGADGCDAVLVRGGGVCWQRAAARVSARLNSAVKLWDFQCVAGCFLGELAEAGKSAPVS